MIDPSLMSPTVGVARIELPPLWPELSSAKQRESEDELEYDRALLEFLAEE